MAALRYGCGWRDEEPMKFPTLGFEDELSFGPLQAVLRQHQECHKDSDTLSAPVGFNLW